jgi:uncharacterized protein YjiS (DUF1127 family)
MHYRKIIHFPNLTESDSVINKDDRHRTIHHENTLPKEQTMSIRSLSLRLRRHEAPLHVRLFRHALVALDVRRQRDHLASLDTALLDDAGITRDAATAEAARPIWDVPPSWRL